MSAVPEAPTAGEIEAAALALVRRASMGPIPNMAVLVAGERVEYTKLATIALTAAYPLLVARITNQAKADALREAADDVNASGVAPVLAKWLRDRADRIGRGSA